jgi:TPR repeat protein
MKSIGQSLLPQLLCLCDRKLSARVLGDKYKKTFKVDRQVEAMVEAGCRFAAGKDAVQDYRKASVWFRKAAKRGSLKGQTLLGTLIAVGYGAEKSAGLAAYWLRSAARAGYAPAEYALGQCYALGFGVPPDKAMARYWLYRAAFEGHKAALLALKKLQHKSTRLLRV